MGVHIVLHNLQHNNILLEYRILDRKVLIIYDYIYCDCEGIAVLHFSIDWK